MAKSPRWTASEAEHALLSAGFEHLPKIIKQVLDVIEESDQEH